MIDDRNQKAPAGADVSTARYPDDGLPGLAELLGPLLARSSGPVGEVDPLELLNMGPSRALLDALYAAGVLVDNDLGDRAHLRKSWAAMSTALEWLSRHRPLSPEVLAAVPLSHRFYLMGHEAGHRELDQAWRRLNAAREDLGAILRRGTTPAPATLGAILAELGGTDPYAFRPADADPWWGCWTDDAAVPADMHWERYRDTCDMDRPLDGLGDLCAFLGGTWGGSDRGGVGGTDRAEGGSITALILRLIVKAQSTPARFTAIARAFPREVTAWTTWNRMRPTPTARELYAELTGEEDTMPGARAATRPAPVAALVDQAELAEMIRDRAGRYHGVLDSRTNGTVAVDRAKLAPALRDLVPEGARAYALPWPAGTRAIYDPTAAIVQGDQVYARALFVEFGDGGRVHLGTVRRLDAAELRRSGWWRCRHCELGATGCPNVAVEKAEAAGHEAICPDSDRMNLSVPRTAAPAIRPRSAISPGDPDWVPGFGPVPGASLGNLGEDL
jgi:hypothetical protein